MKKINSQSSNRQEDDLGIVSNNILDIEDETFERGPAVVRTFEDIKESVQ